MQTVIWKTAINYFYNSINGSSKALCDNFAYLGGVEAGNRCGGG